MVTPSPISADSETTGLDFHERELLLIQLRRDKKTTLRDMRTQNIDDWKPQLEDRSIVKIIQNSLFDCSWWKHKLDIGVQGIWDPYLMELVILGQGEYGARFAGLKYLLKKYRIANIDKEQQKSFIGHVGPYTSAQLKYAAVDVLYLEELMYKQQRVLKKMGLLNTARLENLVAEVVYEMRCTGIAIDRDKWTKVAEENEAKYREANEAIDRLIGGNKIASYHIGVQQDIFETKEAPNEWELRVNWKSHKQVKEFFWEHAGLEVGSLKELPFIRGYPLVDAFMEMQKHSKNVTTYGHGWLEQHVRPDDRVYADFNQIVSTGRFSCREPNMQNLPKDSDTDHRRCFRPTEGYRFVIADFEGQELGLMAHASDDPGWVDPILEGKDLHSVMAAQLFSQWDGVAEKTCVFPRKCKCPGHMHLRQLAKRFNFGIPYGKGPNTIAQDLGISVQEAYTLVRRLKGIAPGLVRWLQENGRNAVRDRYIHTLPPFNRYRDLHGLAEDWHVKNQGYNTPVQGSGADMIKLSMWYAHKAAKESNTGGRILVCVHDELITEAPEETVGEWALLVKDAMKRAAEVIVRPGLINIEPIICDVWEKQSK